MSLVEEISTRQSKDLKRPIRYDDNDVLDNSSKKNGRKQRSTTQNTKINYNLAILEANAHGHNQEDDAEMIITKEERQSQKRLQELDRENYNEQYMTNRLELPKSLLTKQHHHTQGKQTANVKKILNSRKKLNNYLDENESMMMKKIWKIVEVGDSDDIIKTKLLICSICGNNSKYQCVRCKTRYCCVKCGNLHNETRCSTFSG